MLFESKANGGFSLIELIAVIVVLGIISIVALPKFIDFSTDSKIATLKSLKASVQTGANLVFTKSVMQGVNMELNSTVDIDSNGTPDISTHSGFPGVMSNCSQYVSQLPLWLEIKLPSTCISNRAESDEWIGIASASQFYFIPTGYTDQNDNCYLLYTEARTVVGGVEQTLDNIGLDLVTSGC